MISFNCGQISAMVFFPDSFLMRSKSTSIHDGTPLRAVIGSRIDCAASFCNFTGQSGIKLMSSAGYVNGRLAAITSLAAMPLRSPAKLPSACGRMSVQPPRKKNLPAKVSCFGNAFRNKAIVVNAAF